MYASFHPAAQSTVVASAPLCLVRQTSLISPAYQLILVLLFKMSMSVTPLTCSLPCWALPELHEPPSHNLVYFSILSCFGLAWCSPSKDALKSVVASACMCDNADSCIIGGHNISDFIVSQPNYYEGNSTTGAVGNILMWHHLPGRDCW